MSDTYSYEVLEPGGHARLVGNVLDRISRASVNPASAVGSSRAMLGDPETASWMERTTAADGAALIEAVYGNTVVDSGSLLPVRMTGVETVAADESWSSQRTIPASTYFPDGLRSAGSVYDELRADAAVTRVGVVDLGTLEWSYNANWGGYPAFWSPSLRALAAPNAFASGMPSVECAAIEVVSRDTLYDSSSNGITLYGTVQPDISARYSGASDAAAFKTAMSGVMLHYELATPTTTPIDPPLPLSYRVGAGGTERVMVASGTTSAPPIFATRYPLDPADLAASIAPVDGPIAKANHQVGDLIMLGFTLCKATQVIVTGETIAIGTNVTKTTVAAELAALSE